MSQQGLAWWPSHSWVGLFREAREIGCDRRVAVGATITRGLRADDTRRSDMLAGFWAGRGQAQDAYNPGSQILRGDPEEPGTHPPGSRFSDLGGEPLVGGHGLAARSMTHAIWRQGE